MIISWVVWGAGRYCDSDMPCCTGNRFFAKNDRNTTVTIVSKHPSHIPRNMSRRALSRFKISVVECRPHQAISHDGAVLFSRGKIRKHVLASGKAFPIANIAAVHHGLRIHYSNKLQCHFRFSGSFHTFLLIFRD